VPRVGKQLAKFREQKKKKTEKKNPFGWNEWFISLFLYSIQKLEIAK
jgi:hypothetical protein